MARPLLSRADIESAFNELGAAAHAAGKCIEIAVYGGAALILTMPSRLATKDVDAVAWRDVDFLRTQVHRIAEDRQWPDDWLNDAVKGFLSHRQQDPDVLRLCRTYPSEERVGLRVFVPRPEYLLAMKCIAMRVDPLDASTDVDDIRMLVRELGLTTAQDVLDIVAAYYPHGIIRPKTQFGVEEIMAQLAADKDDDKGKR